MSNLRARRDRGFTLVELLVVVVIIGIIAGIAIPVFMNQKAKANDAAAKAQANSVAKSIETLLADSTGAISGSTTTGGAVTVGTASADVKTTDGLSWSVDGTPAGYCIAIWTDKPSKYTSTSPLYYDSLNGGLRASGNCAQGSPPVTAGGGGGAPVTLAAALLSSGIEDLHSCAVAAGAVYCWGANSFGQLSGAGNKLVPTKVAGALTGKSVTHVATGRWHTCAIADGEVFCWGQNASRQLGNGTANSNTPVAVLGLAGKVVVHIAAAGSATCALVDDGSVYCWGQGSVLGNGANVTTATPTLVAGAVAGKQVAQIEGGRSHFCALTTDGGVYCWGNDDYGQMGDEGYNNQAVPVQVEGLLSGVSVTQLGVGLNHACAAGGGAVYCWGDGQFGQLGNNATPPGYPYEMAQVVGSVNGATITQLSAGASTTCASTTGRLFCWGTNPGDGSATSLVPVEVGGALTGGVDAVAAGDSGTCALKSGTVYCWGQGTSGALGDNQTGNRLVPGPTAPLI